MAVGYRYWSYGSEAWRVADQGVALSQAAAGHRHQKKIYIVEAWRVAGRDVIITLTLARC